MNVNSARLVYFSPTQTTRKIIEGVARGLLPDTVEHTDLTIPDAKMQKSVEMRRNDVAIIGSPVYSGRVPADAAARLKRLKGNGTPAVIVAVYGNRAYEDALRELRDIAVEAGFRPFAAGVFIGEHSFSSDVTPIAAGRPDEKDLRKAEEFGRRVHEKIRNIQSTGEMLPLNIPGNFPYKERRVLPEISPVTKETLCVKCEQCARTCPASAIIVRETVVTYKSLCVKCCACVKSCSTGARIMDDLFIRQVAEQLSMNCSERREPEIYM